MKRFIPLFILLAVFLNATALHAATPNIDDLRTQAESGNSTAQATLGSMYEMGRGVKEDYTEAAKWLRMAADQGNAQGQCDLGILYVEGWGVPEDFNEAAKWLLKAANQGLPEAQFKLGIVYGMLTPPNLPESMKWYRKAADQGEEDAMNEVRKDTIKYRSLASQGDANAKALLDILTTSKSPPAPVVISTSTPKASPPPDLLAKAQSGNITAQLALGLVYEKGDGVPQDYAEAMTWYRKAADQGDAHAQCNVGEMYENGEGVPIDYGVAMQWYRKSADQGYAQAEYHIGVFYNLGWGVSKDATEAITWLQKAYDKGYVPAYDMISTIYILGTQGVPRNVPEAWKWRVKAAETGDAGAIAMIKQAITHYRPLADQGDATAKAVLDILTQAKLPPEPAAAAMPAKQSATGNPQADLKTAIMDIARMSRAGERLDKTYMPPEQYAQQLAQSPLPPGPGMDFDQMSKAFYQNPQAEAQLQQLRQIGESEAKSWESLKDQTPTYNKAGDEATYMKTQMSDQQPWVWDKTQPVTFIKINGLWYLKTWGSH